MSRILTVRSPIAQGLEIIPITEAEKSKCDATLAVQRVVEGRHSAERCCCALTAICRAYILGRPALNSADTLGLKTCLEHVVVERFDQMVFKACFNRAIFIG